MGCCTDESLDTNVASQNHVPIAMHGEAEGVKNLAGTPEPRLIASLAVQVRKWNCRGLTKGLQEDVLCHQQ